MGQGLIRQQQTGIAVGVEPVARANRMGIDGLHPLSPSKGRIRPSSPQALSSRRRLVVPTAMIRPPAVRALLSRPATLASIRPHSACIAWSPVSSALTGRKVPAPTWSVSVSFVTPASSSAAMSSGVKCSAAVGAATAPSVLANIV